MENISIDTTKVSAKGQVVIPVDVRNKLQLEAGNKLFVMASEDAIILQKTNSLNEKDKITFSQKAKSLIRKMGLSI
tara:strand:+ start:2869 stop:3096 length:228 start_codon:yes stop_codon:yes gene_type:complete